MKLKKVKVIWTLEDGETITVYMETKEAADKCINDILMFCIKGKLYE